MKKESNLARLLGYAGRHKYLTIASWILSAVSALVALVPFWYIWRIIREVIETAPDFSRAEHLARYGWMAVAFAALALVIYIAALMCSHIAAFRIAANIRRAVMRHIVSLPLGFMDSFGSGKPKPSARFPAWIYCCAVSAKRFLTWKSSIRMPPLHA